MLTFRLYFTSLSFYFTSLSFYFTFSIFALNYKKIMKNIKRRLRNETRTFDGNGNKVVMTTEYGVSVDMDEYFYTFTKPLGLFYEINCITDVKILVYMCEKCEFNTNVVRITALERRELMEITKIKTQGISNAMRRLRGLGLIYGSGGVYEINPNLWWRGNMKERRDLLIRDAEILRRKFVKTLKNEDGKLVDMVTGEVIK